MTVVVVVVKPEPVGTGPVEFPDGLTRVNGGVPTAFVLGGGKEK